MPVVDDQYEPLSSGEITPDSVANAPQLLHALLDQLVNVVGVAEEDITIGDPTGLFVSYLYDPLHADFPGVHYLDNRGTGQGIELLYLPTAAHHVYLPLLVRKS